VKIYDIICGSVFAAVAVYALIAGLSFPKDAVMAIGPSYFPNILAFGLLLFSLMLIGRAVTGRSRGTGEGFDPKNKGTRRLVLSILIAVLFVVILDLLGFILDCTLVMFFYLLLLGIKKRLLLAVVPPAVTASVYLVFEKFLSISLPTGILGGIL